MREQIEIKLESMSKGLGQELLKDWRAAVLEQSSGAGTFLISSPRVNQREGAGGELALISF